MTDVGTNGFIWTSSSSAASGSGAIYVGCLHFDANSVEPLYGPHRAYGRSVRCVQASARLFFFWVKSRKSRCVGFERNPPLRPSAICAVLPAVLIAAPDVAER